MTRRSFVLALASTGYYPPPDSAGGWRQSPKEAGLDVAELDRAFEFVKTTTKHGGLLVARRGWLAYERYFGRGHRESTPNLASCGKSFTSISMGILLQERRDAFPKGLRQRVYGREYLPEAEVKDDRRKELIELGHLLAMSGGIRGNNPSYVSGKPVTLNPAGPDGWSACTDKVALATDLWCAPEAGYSYATASVHLVSMILRQVAGKELQQYVAEKLAQPLGWGRWGWGYRRPEVTHTPGGGGIALRPTDMLRFAYLLLRGGRWNGAQVVPADYVRQCGSASAFNPHYPYSFQFNVNSEGTVPGVPRDAFWKTGSGGHCFYMVPSLDLVVFKQGGRDDQFSPSNTGIVPPYEYDRSREGWKPPADTDFYGRTLQMIIKAVRA